jgi:steroid 5-alpha reductase family enzyme
MDQLLSIVLSAAIILWLYATGWFLVSVILKRNDMADIAWGLGYCLLCVWLWITQPTGTLSLLLYGLVCVWGVRLSVHIYLRNRGKSEDFRYQQWRTEWGKSFYWRSYLQVYLLQAFFLLIISLPIVWASLFTTRWSLFSAVGLSIWVVGFLFQSIGDFQLTQFSKTKQPGEIMQRGLWKYSRHPNYFGEILMWWGIYCIVLPVPNSGWTIISPVTITLLLVFVSGVPMLEKKYAGNVAYEAYKKRTWALVPKLW